MDAGEDFNSWATSLQPRMRFLFTMPTSLVNSVDGNLLAVSSAVFYVELQCGQGLVMELQSSFPSFPADGTGAS